MTDLTATRPARRPRPQAVRLTEAAADRIRQLTEAASGPCAGLRIGVKNGGCAGQEYTVEYAERVEPLDEVVEDKGATVLIAARSTFRSPTWPRNSSSATRTRPTPAAAARA